MLHTTIESLCSQQGQKLFITSFVSRMRPWHVTGVGQHGARCGARCGARFGVPDPPVAPQSVPAGLRFIKAISTLAATKLLRQFNLIFYN